MQWMSLTILVMAGLGWLFGLKAYPDHSADRHDGSRQRRCYGCSTSSTSLRMSTGSGAGTGDFTAAALPGSSYQLPSFAVVLRATSAFHHIHHLSPRIPNYNLQRCHSARSLFKRSSL